MSLNEDSLYDSKRVRRSAALNSNKAWATLLVNKKGASGGNYEDDDGAAKDVASDEEYSEAIEEKPKKKASKRQSKAIEDDDGTKLKRGRVNKKSAVKNLPVESAENPSENLNEPLRSSPKNLKSEINVENSPVKTTQLGVKVSPNKSPIKDIKPAVVVKAKTPNMASATNEDSSSNSLLSKYEERISESPNVVKPKLPAFPPSLKVGAQGAMNKEQLEKIAREVEKHHFGGGEAGEEDDENDSFDEEKRMVLDDPDDEDYFDGPFRTQKRVGILRKPARGGLGPGGVPYSLIASRDAGLSQRGGPSRGRGRPPSIMTGNGMTRGAASGNLVMNPSISRTNIMSAGSNTIRSNNMQPPTSNNNPTVKVLRLKQQGNGNFMQMQPPQGSLQSHNQLRQSISAMNSNLNKELDESIEQYAKQPNRIIPGSSIREFTNIINSLMSENERLSQDLSRQNASNRDMIKKMRATHLVDIEFRDNRIQQLENSVELLNSRLNLTFKRCQLNVLKHETAASGSDVPSTIRLANSFTASIKSPHILKKAELNGEESSQTVSTKKPDEDDLKSKKSGGEQAEEYLAPTTQMASTPQSSESEPSLKSAAPTGPRVIMPQYYDEHEHSEDGMDEEGMLEEEEEISRDAASSNQFTL